MTNKCNNDNDNNNIKFRWLQSAGPMNYACFPLREGRVVVIPLFEVLQFDILANFR